MQNTEMAGVSLISGKLSAGESVFMPKDLLTEVFPHRGAALVATCGSIDDGKVSLFLERRDFGKYTRGHSWYFPLHWLGELAGHALGLQVVAQLYKQEGATAWAIGLPSTLQLGGWGRKQQFTVDLKSGSPVVVSPILESLDLRHISGTVVSSGSVRFEQDDRSGIWEGVRLAFVKG